jgi:hypothetical protein
MSPKSCSSSWSVSGDRDLDLGKLDPWVLFIPSCPGYTGLTSALDRSDRCGSVDSRFGVPLRSRVGRLCVLGPRSSGTPVATWAWPTWVVSQRRVLEVVFIS